MNGEFDKAEGMYFKVFQTLEEAQCYAQTVICAFGYSATIFDYDQYDNTFLEFYET